MCFVQAKQRANWWQASLVVKRIFYVNSYLSKSEYLSISPEFIRCSVYLCMRYSMQPALLSTFTTTTTLTQFTIENWTSADNGNGFKVLVKRKEISKLLYKIFIFSFGFSSFKKKKQPRHLIQNPKLFISTCFVLKAKVMVKCCLKQQIRRFSQCSPPQNTIPPAYS